MPHVPCSKIKNFYSFSKRNFILIRFLLQIVDGALHSAEEAEYFFEHGREWP
jgi:hypothetical protein